MTAEPDDFGGFVGYWLNGRAVLVRYGQGRPIEGVHMTPLNLLQARKLLDDLIATGNEAGDITAEHHRQSGLLPTSYGIDDIPSPDAVDRVAGED